MATAWYTGCDGVEYPQEVEDTMRECGVREGEMSNASTRRISETEWEIRHLYDTLTGPWAIWLPVRIHRGGLEIGDARGFISWADLDQARRDRGIGPEEPEGDTPDFHQAIGAIPLKPGMTTATEAIRKAREEEQS